MRIDVLTLFPEMFHRVLESSILKRARDKGLITVNLVNFRDYTTDKHNQVDDYPYGGGTGMVLKPEPIFAAVEAIENWQKARIIMLTPQGKVYNQKTASEFAEAKHLIMLAGHYEGFDERIREHLVTDEISIGDYVLTGGELPALVLIDSIARLLPDVLGSEESLIHESFTDDLLEYPQYTRPESFRGWQVPEVLLSGHHANIEKWRKEQSLLRTLIRRKDLLEKKE
jgi:tRNA (guanine37-N1)-methyltransferase